MNIAVINPEYPSPSRVDHGGIATYCYNLSNAIARQGHTVQLLLREGTVHENLEDGVKVHYFSSRPQKTLLSPFLRRINSQIYWERGCSDSAYSLLSDLNRENRIDIAEVAEYNGLAHEIPRQAPFPVVIKFHTPSYLVDKLNNVHGNIFRKQWYRYEYKAVKRGDGFCSPSHALKDIASKHFKIETSDIKCIKYPMITEEFENMKKIRFPHNDRIDILFSGRLERRKGAEFIIFAINDILGCDERINLTFAGETNFKTSESYHQAIERTIDPAYRGRVWFLGPVNRISLISLYCSSAIFLNPSIFDNSPYSLLEAMASKLPVIASDTGGINEIINHKKNGLLYQPEDRDGLIKCIKQYLNSAELREKLAQNAYFDIRKLFSPEAVALSTISYYKDIIEKWKAS